MKLDAIDLRLLRLLQKDASLTNKELAARLGLTTTPVFERIKKLKKEQYILRQTVVLNAEKLGLGILAYCEVSLKEHNHGFIADFEKEISKIKEVLECHHITGPFDYLLKVRVADMPKYQFFLKEQLAQLKNISRVESHFVMTEVKNSSSLPI